jgi:hypothetical protein
MGGVTPQQQAAGQEAPLEAGSSMHLGHMLTLSHLPRPLTHNKPPSRTPTPTHTHTNSQGLQLCVADSHQASVQHQSPSMARAAGLQVGRTPWGLCKRTIPASPAAAPPCKCRTAARPAMPRQLWWWRPPHSPHKSIGTQCCQKPPDQNAATHQNTPKDGLQMFWRHTACTYSIWRVFVTATVIDMPTAIAPP